MKKHTLSVKNTDITIFTKKDSDYISLTDISRFKDKKRSDYIIQILNPSNSMDLNNQQDLIVFHLHPNDGLRIPEQLDCFIRVNKYREAIQKLGKG